MMTSPHLFHVPSGRVLAFAKGWSIESLDAGTVQSMRERIRSLGDELIVMNERGAWAFRADDDVFGEYLDRVPADLALASTLFAARGGDDSVFVIDGARAVRVGQGSRSLVEALDAAAALLVTRRLAAAVTPRVATSLVRWTEYAS
ncbi:hypothetical protein BH11MYX3_BH11MYX3_15840 [soil metagenome]